MLGDTFWGDADRDDVEETLARRLAPPCRQIFTTTKPGSDDYLYWVFNALFLAIGIALNLLGSALRERRVRARAEAA